MPVLRKGRQSCQCTACNTFSSFPWEIGWDLMLLLLSSQQALQVINYYGMAAGKKKDQEEIGLEDVLRLLKMELHCNARRIGYKNMQFSSLFFCSVRILGAFSSLSKIIVILFILTF